MSKDKKKTRAERIDELNREVWGQIGTGIKQGRIMWGRITINIVSGVGIILAIIFWNPITDFLAGELRATVTSLNDPTSAPVIANWLLAVLILATIGVVFIPFLSAGITDLGSGLIASPITLTTLQ